MPDTIDAAVQAAAEAADAAPKVSMLRVSVTMSSTNRPFAVEVPEDMTDAELIEATAWMLSTLAKHLASQRGKTRSGLLLPGRS